jgi:hypothetical protein
MSCEEGNLSPRLFRNRETQVVIQMIPTAIALVTSRSNATEFMHVAVNGLKTAFRGWNDLMNAWLKRDAHLPLADPPFLTKQPVLEG